MKRVKVVVRRGNRGEGGSRKEYVLEYGEPLAHPDSLTVHQDGDDDDCIEAGCITITLEDA